MPDSTEVRVEEVQDAIRRMNSGNSPSLDGVKVGMAPVIGFSILINIVHP